MHSCIKSWKQQQWTWAILSKVFFFPQFVAADVHKTTSMACHNFYWKQTIKIMHACIKTQKSEKQQCHSKQILQKLFSSHNSQQICTKTTIKSHILYKEHWGSIMDACMHTSRAGKTNKNVQWASCLFKHLVCLDFGHGHQGGDLHTSLLLLPFAVHFLPFSCPEQNVMNA